MKKPKLRKYLSISNFSAAVTFAFAVLIIWFCQISYTNIAVIHSLHKAWITQEAKSRDQLIKIAQLQRSLNNIGLRNLEQQIQNMPAQDVLQQAEQELERASTLFTELENDLGKHQSLDNLAYLVETYRARIYRHRAQMDAMDSSQELIEQLALPETVSANIFQDLDSLVQNDRDFTTKKITALVKESINSLLLSLLFFLVVLVLSGAMISYFLKRGIAYPLQLIAGDLLTASKSHKSSVRLRNTKNNPFELRLITDVFNRLMDRVEQTENYLKDVLNEAVEADRLKSDFLANISHELRTPLHGIISFADLSKKYADRPDNKAKLKKSLTNVNSSAERLLNLVDDLLDLAKLEAGKLDMRFEEHLINDIVGASIDEVQALADKKSLELTLENTEEHEVIVECDKNRIMQVTVNLLSNAIKFSEEHSFITIKTYKTMQEGLVPSVAVKIIDNGIGIPEDELESVFQKFEQSSSTETGAGGTGLGLSICKEIVASHRGTIFAENNLEKGTSFTFTLPLYQQAAQKVMNDSLGTEASLANHSPSPL
jgi:signal transduction histidine kinase